MIGKSIISWPCPARVQSCVSRHDEARILSSVRAESDLSGADGLSFPASLCGGKAIFHWISDSHRSCLRATALHPGHDKGDTESEGGTISTKPPHKFRNAECGLRNINYWFRVSGSGSLTHLTSHDESLIL
jgi:hypothetical protein